MIIKTKRATADGWLYFDAGRDPMVSRVRFYTGTIPKGCTGRDFPILMGLDEVELFLRSNLDEVQCELRMNALAEMAGKGADSIWLTEILGDKRTDPHAWLIEFTDVDGTPQRVITDQDTYLMTESGQTVDKYKGPWVFPVSVEDLPEDALDEIRISKRMTTIGEKSLLGDPEECCKTTPEDVNEYFGTRPSLSEVRKAEVGNLKHSQFPGGKDQ